MSAPSTRLHSSVEQLESRIAPAVLYHYTDVDGDAVTVKISKGALSDVVFTTAPSGNGMQLLKIDLQGKTVFQNADITVSAKATGGLGNGKANIGYIQAMGIDLGRVTVAGDLGRIEAGDFVLGTAGLKLLSVDSMHAFTLDPTLASPATGVYDVVSHVKGTLTTLIDRGDFANAGLAVDNLGTALILGSLVGSKTAGPAAAIDFTGQLYSENNIGKVIIKGDLVGGTGNSSGSIVANNGAIGSISIGGSVLGGSGSGFTGAIFAGGRISTIAVKGDLVGGSGPLSGYIYGGGTALGLGIVRLTVGGNVVGGSNNNTGEIFAVGPITSLSIGGNLIGGSNHGAALTATGYVEALTFTTASIGGIISGTNDGSGLTKSGSVRAYDNIVNLTVRRDIIGNPTNPVYISAFGAPVQTKTDVAIRTLTVGGSVLFSEVLAGYDVDTTLSNRGPALNGDAQITSVKIAGNFISSSLVAGVKTVDANFGDADDVLVAGTSSTILASIGSVVIGGQAYGSNDPTDAATYGIEAQQVGKVKIGGYSLVLAIGPSNDTFAAGTAHGTGPTFGTTNTDKYDFHVFEVM